MKEKKYFQNTDPAYIMFHSPQGVLMKPATYVSTTLKCSYLLPETILKRKLTFILFHVKQKDYFFTIQVSYHISTFKKIHFAFRIPLGLSSCKTTVVNLSHFMKQILSSRD